MLSAAFAIQLAVMIGLPVLVAWHLRRRWGASLVLLAAGALAWIGSQVVHLPLNAALAAVGALREATDSGPAWALPLTAALLGLTAGLCEEVARWLLLRSATLGARGLRDAVYFGVGHGGFESVWFGVLAAATLINAWATSRAGVAAMGVPPGEAGEAARQLAAYWSAPAWTPLLAAAERAMTMFFHVAASALVMVAVARRRLWPLAAAIALHAAADATVVWVLATHGGVAAELAVLAWMPPSALVLWLAARALRRPTPPAPA